MQRKEIGGPRRGIKICDNCNCENGVRAYECKACENPFRMKKLRKGRKSRLVEDWTALSTGQRIRVVGGSGPFYEHEGERKYLTDRGKYTVRTVTKDGLWVRQDGGAELFLWMRGTQKSPLGTGVTRSPHKLLCLG